ncbi:MAG TPA: hypothetical protein ENG75_03395 [Nitrospirae bacterium]|nr:hypothetical protein [Nitrospirota bacterium]
MENEIKLTEKLAPYHDTAENMLAQVSRAELTNMEDCSKLGDLAKLAKVQFKKLEDERKEWVTPLNEQVKKLNLLFKQQQAPFLEIEKTAKNIMGAFMAAEERRQAEIRRIEREKAEAEALIAAEKAAEEQRIADEKARKAREEAAKLEAAGRAEEAAKAAEEAAAAEKAAAEHAEQADAILEESIDAGEKTPDKQIARGDYGSTSSVRKTWQHKVVDPDLVPRKYMMVDESAVKAAVKNGVREIPGISIFEDSSVVIR